jgi:branched-subunit amino acid transport protein
MLDVGCSHPVSSLRPSRYKLLTFFVAAFAGVFVADYFIPAAGTWQNLLLAAVIAALIAVAMVWLGGRRKE